MPRVKLHRQIQRRRPAQGVMKHPVLQRPYLFVSKNNALVRNYVIKCFFRLCSGWIADFQRAAVGVQILQANHAEIQAFLQVLVESLCIIVQTGYGPAQIFLHACQLFFGMNIAPTGNMKGKTAKRRIRECAVHIAVQIASIHDLSLDPAHFHDLVI